MLAYGSCSHLKRERQCAALAEIVDHARDHAADESRRWPRVALALQYRYSELSERGCWRRYGGANLGNAEKN
jgi:hypothetical protein